MRPSSTDRPTQAQLQLPLLQFLAALDAPVRPLEAADHLARQFAVASDARTATVTAARGTSRQQTVAVWPRHVRFARQKLAEKGYVTSADYGRWTLTDEGQAAARQARAGVAVTVWVDDRTGEPVHVEVEKLATLPTVHTLHRGDARDLSWIPDGEIALVASSAPYFDLKPYDGRDHQLHIGRDYEQFLDELTRVLRECHRVLMPGGRVALNVGDVLRSRKQHGRHHVLPLHAHVMVRGRQIGFDNLTPILWRKLGNIHYEQGGRGVLGKPFEPNGIIAADYEHILNLRKPGGYRQPTAEQRAASRLSKDDYHRYFRSVWEDVPGIPGKGDHPAPWNEEIPFRLVRMFSFVGDTVLDPFAGTFRTSTAALRAGRHSIGNEVTTGYFEHGVDRMVGAVRAA